MSAREAQARPARYPLVDLARVLAFASVVVLHVVSPDGAGETANVLARWGVPYFFMVAGYFASGKDPYRVGRGLRKALGVALLAVALYLVLQVAGLWDAGPVFGLTTLLEPEALRSFLVYGSVPFAYHLWFLFGLVYAYVFYVAWESCRFPHVALYVMGLLLFALRTVTFETGGSPDSLGDLGEVAHSWYFVGIPMFVLGVLLRDLALRGLRVPVPLLVLGAVAGAWGACREEACFGLQEVYVGSAVSALCVLGLCTRFSAPALLRAPGLSAYLSLGSSPTMWAYVLHLAMIGWVSRLAPALAADQWALYGVVVVCSLAAGTLIGALARQVASALRGALARDGAVRGAHAAGAAEGDGR